MSSNDKGHVQDGQYNGINEENSVANSSQTDHLTEPTYNVDEAIEHIGFGRFQWKLSIITGCAWMADAMEMMILAIISPQLKCEWQLYSYQEALITTVVFIGMMCSSSMWGTICDNYGRRAGLILCAVWTFYVGFLSAFAPDLKWILILRGLVGFGVGGVPQSVTLYSEFLPLKSRAVCIMAIEIFWAIGTCFEVILALIVMPTLGWRWLLAFSALPLFFFSCACKWLPESARYNVLCGNLDKAYDTLKRVADDNKTDLPVGKLVAGERPKRGRLVDLFSDSETTRTTLLLWFIWFSSAFTYYGIVLVTTELFQIEDTGDGQCINTSSITDCHMQCHTLTTKDYGDLIWTTLAEFPGMFLSLAVIEYLGRRKTMALDFTGFAIFVYLLTLCTTRNVMVFFLFAARAFTGGGFQAAYVYTPEVYPTNVRAIGLGSCSGMARIGAIITPFVAQVMLVKSEQLTMAIYGTVSLLCALACLFLPIETAGRSMQDASSKSSNPVVNDNIAETRQ